MGASKSLFWAVCIVCICSGWSYTSGVVGDGTGGRKEGAAAVVRAAQKEIGVQESMENSGERIDTYNAYVGFKKVAWCASFASFCFGQAGYSQPRSAWCPALFPSGKIAKEPAPGMIMGIYFPAKGRVAHCGIVEAVRNSWCTTIEGNTNLAGSREGDGVFRRIRHRRTIHCFADWVIKP